MKFKFKRFLKKSLIVFIVSSFLILSFVSVSSAYTVQGSENRDYSNFHFLSFTFYQLTSSDNGSDVWTIIDDDLISTVRYRISSDGWLSVDFFFTDYIFIPENNYHVSLSFTPIGDNAITDRVYYGSYYSSMSRYGSFTIDEDSISSYRLGLNESNDAVVDYAYTDSSTYPTVFSEYSLSDSSKVFYYIYYLNYDFVYHAYPPVSSNQVSFYFYNFRFDSIPFDTFQTQYGWDSPFPPPSMDNVVESGKLENQILSDTSADVETTKNFLTNFKLYTWLQNGLLAVTNIFEIFAKLPFIDNLLEYSLVLGIFAFIVGMSVSLLKPTGGGRSGGRRR